MCGGMSSSVVLWSGMERWMVIAANPTVVGELSLDVFGSLDGIQDLEVVARHV
jgi:hypothetical protein